MKINELVVFILIMHRQFSELSADHLRQSAATLLDQICRSASPLSNEEIADAIGISETTLRDWRRNNHPIHPSILTKLQEKTGARQGDIDNLRLYCRPALDKGWRQKHFRSSYEEAGALLRALREAAGISREDLADHLEIARDSLRRWENGLSPITASYLPDIKEKLSLNETQYHELVTAALPALDPARLAEHPQKKRAGLLLRAYRELSEKTIYDLAADLGLTFTALQKWETGEAPIQGELLPDIKRHLNIGNADYRALLLTHSPALDPEHLKQLPPRERAGKLLRTYRELLGDFQKAFSTRQGINVSQAQLNNWELSKQPIAKHYDLPMTNIFEKAQKKLPKECRWFDAAYFQAACN